MEYQPELHPLPEIIDVIVMALDFSCGMPSVYTGEMESGGYKFLDEVGLFVVMPDFSVEEK